MYRGSEASWWIYLASRYLAAVRSRMAFLSGGGGPALDPPDFDHSFGGLIVWWFQVFLLLNLGFDAKFLS